MSEVLPLMLTPENFPKHLIHHKTLLAENYEGFLSLSKLTSLSYGQGLYRAKRGNYGRAYRKKA